jgi:hypothetical protein
VDQILELMQYESARARHVDKGHRYTINATPYPDACPAARARVTRKDRMSTRLLRIGPVASEEAAELTCDRLKKMDDWDCYTRPAA